MKKIYLEWLDHCSVTGWVSPENVQKPMLMRSFGIVAAETDEFIAISTTQTCDKEYADPLTILKINIIKRKDYK